MKPTIRTWDTRREAEFPVTDKECIRIYQVSDFAANPKLEAPLVSFSRHDATWQELTPFLKALTAAFALARKWDDDTGKPISKLTNSDPAP